jgi:predicted CoA-binding protein
MAWTDASEEEVAGIVRTAKVVAVVGMKGEAASWTPAFTVPQVMQQRGIRVIPVNPTIQASLGEKSLGSVAELTSAPDVIQVFRRPEYVGPLADEILALPKDRRPRWVWLQEGITNLPAAEKLEAAGIRTIMDRCYAVDLAKFVR